MHTFLKHARMSLCCMSKIIVSLDHTMEEVVAAFRDADKELPMVKMDTQSGCTWLKW